MAGVPPVSVIPAAFSAAVVLAASAAKPSTKTAPDAAIDGGRQTRTVVRAEVINQRLEKRSKTESRYTVLYKYYQRAPQRAVRQNASRARSEPTVLWGRRGQR